MTINPLLARRRLNLVKHRKEKRLRDKENRVFMASLDRELVRIRMQTRFEQELSVELKKAGVI